MTTREERAELREWLTHPGDPEGNAPLTRREAHGLLDDIDRLTAERDEARLLMGDWAARAGAAEAERDDLAAAVERDALRVTDREHLLRADSLRALVVEVEAERDQAWQDADEADRRADRLAARLVLVTDLMGEYFGALRGSWGGIDGRSERQRWCDFRDHLAEGVTDKARLRADLDVCPAGGGHWTEYCYDSCTLDGADQ